MRWYALIFISSVIHGFIVPVNSTLGEVHTSIAHMKQLVLAEQQVVVYLKNISNHEAKDNEAIKSYMGGFLQGSADDIVENPINSYHFLQNLVEKFPLVEDSLKKDNLNDSLSYIESLRSEVLAANSLDVNGAAWSLVQLQNMYNLPIDSLVQGEIHGAKSMRPLSADDCLKMAQQSFKNLEFELSNSWMNQALELLKNQHSKTDETTTKIQEINALLQGRELMGSLMSDLAKNTDRNSLDKLSGLGIPTSFQKKIYAETDEEIHVDFIERRYKNLCRGKSETGDLEMLYCAYVRGKDPYRLLMPFKAELLKMDPIVIQFHDVLRDEEAEEIQELAMPKLETTQVHSFVTHQAMKSIARNGKTSWVGSDEGPNIRMLFDRITEMTGLSTEFAEKLHALNYGVGGHYDIHIDFFDLANKNVNPEGHTGDRIATVLFYLNDVVEGGSTVFPVLDIGVKPEKGSALMWFNLLRNGKGDFRTLHASCPVLLGQKWIANLWLHERGQEFIWPCGLSPED